MEKEKWVYWENNELSETAGVKKTSSDKTNEVTAKKEK